MEQLPPVLDSTAPQPPLFDGTTRLYLWHLTIPSQMVWITRNCKGLHDRIQLVLLGEIPPWCKELGSKLPALEHNGKITSGALDVIKYIDSNFEGPSLFPEDPTKRKFGEELLSYSERLDAGCSEMAVLYNGIVPDPIKKCVEVFARLDKAVCEYEDGPFFLGQFSLVDIVYIPCVERLHTYLAGVFEYDLTQHWPNLGAWLEEMEKIEAYKQTKCDPEGVKYIVEEYKKRLATLKAKQRQASRLYK